MALKYKNEKFWDRIAGKYDRIEQADIAYSLFFEKAKGYLNANDIVLDFGCGTGLICNEIAISVGRIHAIDLSTKMLAIAKSKASARKIQNIDFEQTTLDNPKFKAETFDAIIAFNIFHLLEAPSMYIQHIHNLLKPGGLLLSATPCMREVPVLKTLLKLLTLIGVTPRINSFTGVQLKHCIECELFQLLEFKKIKPKSPHYFIIAQKKG